MVTLTTAGLTRPGAHSVLQMVAVNGGKVRGESVNWGRLLEILPPHHANYPFDQRNIFIISGSKYVSIFCIIIKQETFIFSYRASYRVTLYSEGE